MGILEDMVAEVERLRTEMGLVPVRYHVGGAAMAAMRSLPLREAKSEDGLPAVAALAGTPVLLDPTMGWDEWAPVYRGSR